MWQRRTDDQQPCHYSNTPRPGVHLSAPLSGQYCAIILSQIKHLHEIKPLAVQQLIFWSTGSPVPLCWDNYVHLLSPNQTSHVVEGYPMVNHSAPEQVSRNSQLERKNITVAPCKWLDHARFFDRYVPREEKVGATWTSPWGGCKH